MNVKDNEATLEHATRRLTEVAADDQSWVFRNQAT